MHENACKAAMGVLNVRALLFVNHDRNFIHILEANTTTKRRIDYDSSCDSLMTSCFGAPGTVIVAGGAMKPAALPAVLEPAILLLTELTDGMCSLESGSSLMHAFSSMFVHLPLVPA